MSQYSRKRNFWLKLDRGFFKRHDIKIIEGLDNGYEYIVFYMKLLCESIDHNGELRFNDLIPYDESMLATITGHNIDIVRSALQVFVKFGMIEVWSDDTLYMKQIENMIGSQTESAQKKQIQRQAKQALIAQGGQGVDNCPLDKDIDIDIDKELDKDKETITQLKECCVDNAREETIPSPKSIYEVDAYIRQSGRKVNVNEIWQKTNGLTEYNGKPVYNWKGLVNVWAETELSVPYISLG